MPTTSGPSLLPPRELERICRGLATLDAILCPEWEHRYFSFNAAWSAGQRMGSMRNGEGDDWFIVFGPAGVFLKSFWHEHQPRVDPAVIYGGLPAALQPQLAEAAFSMADVTYGGWHDHTGWTLRGAVAPIEDGLPLDDARCERLRPGCALADLEADLAEIGYGAPIP